MNLPIKDYMNMGVKSVATSPGEIIHQINKLGKHTKRQNTCINHLVDYFHKHDKDSKNSNDMLNQYVIDWFQDHDIVTIQSALNDNSRDSEWKSPQMQKGLKNLAAKGYKYVCGPYAMGDSSVNHPAPVGYKMMTRFLWDLDDKQNAVEEMEDI